MATPAIDRLAADSVVFEQLTAASPICSPSRGSMLTGRWPQRNGLLGLVHHGFSFNPGERHAAALFRDADYETTLFHFQHVAHPHEWADLGFESYLCRSRDEEFPNYPDMARTAPEVGDAFTDWLEARTDSRAFFTQVNFNETHTPFDFGGVAPDRSRGVTVPPWIEADAKSEAHFAALQGAVGALDAGVGKVLEALQQSGLMDSTIILFATDHGFEARRDKWTCYESGLGIAGMLRYGDAGICGERRLRTPCSNVDLLPTLLQLAGIERPENFDGVSMADSLLAQEEPTARPVFGIYHNSGVRSVRVGGWKLIRNFSAEPYAPPPPVRLGDASGAVARVPVELYHLDVDPHELLNQAAEQPEIVSELNQTLLTWMRSVEDHILLGCCS